MNRTRRHSERYTAATDFSDADTEGHSHLLENVRTSRDRLDVRRTEQATAIGAGHPLLRGAWSAVVFCGQRSVLAELAGEATAHTSRKFVLADPSLDQAEDFARSSGASFPNWPAADVRPIDGVCFVFTEIECDHVARLLQHGAVRDEHFIVTVGLAGENEDRSLGQHLDRIIAHAPPSRPIVILGYGHQGQRIARIARHELGLNPARLLIHDAHEPSRLVAVRDGLQATDDERCVDHAAAVIASPIAPYDNIARLLRRAEAVGIATLDNSRKVSGLRHWIARDNVLLDEAGARAIAVESRCARSATLACGDAALWPLIAASVIRQDERMLPNARFAIPHLHSGQRVEFSPHESIDLAAQWSGDGLASSTFRGLQRAFVSVTDRATHGFFAARELCLDLWPDTTRQVFPSEHAVDIGVTPFERLLKANLDAREIVSTMQTPTQRVALGVAAAHAVGRSNQFIIEIGSAYGGSALLMAAATEGTRSPIISIDPDAPTRDIMRFAFERHGYGQRLQQIVATSDDAIARLRHLEGQCAVVFIDGLHTADAVARDFANYAPLLAIGGCLLFHDVCPALHSVMQAVIERVLPDHRFRPLCLVDGLLALECVQPTV